MNRNWSSGGGRTWTDLINYAPFFTSGYNCLLSIAPGRFLAIFDYAAPQPWKDHAGSDPDAASVRVAFRVVDTLFFESRLNLQ